MLPRPTQMAKNYMLTLFKSLTPTLPHQATKKIQNPSNKTNTNDKKLYADTIQIPHLPHQVTKKIQKPSK